MDLNVQAFRLVRQATEEPPKKALLIKAASQRGGLIGGKVRAAKLSPERRSEIARRASTARWDGNKTVQIVK